MRPLLLLLLICVYVIHSVFNSIYYVCIELVWLVYQVHAHTHTAHQFGFYANENSRK